MVEDSRGSRKPRSEVVTIGAGANTPIEALSLRDEERFSIEQVRVQYDPSGTVASTLELYDTSEEGGSFTLDDAVDTFIMSAGEEKNPDMEWDDIEENVVASPDGNSDAPIVVTIGGYIISG